MEKQLREKRALQQDLRSAIGRNADWNCTYQPQGAYGPRDHGLLRRWRAGIIRARA